MATIRKLRGRWQAQVRRRGVAFNSRTTVAGATLFRRSGSGRPCADRSWRKHLPKEQVDDLTAKAPDLIPQALIWSNEPHAPVAQLDRALPSEDGPYFRSPFAKPFKINDIEHCCWLSATVIALSAR
jgi:hypothetical protein